METKELFFNAVMKGDWESLKRLIDQDPVVFDARNEQGVSAVLTAMYYGHPEIASRLVEHGALLDVFDASAVGALERLEEILDAQPESANAWAQDGFQPLGLASFFCQLGAARLLLQKGAQVVSHSRNGLQVTPLNSAAAGGHLEIAKLLLEHGADSNARQEGDFVPLHSAAQNGQVEMVKLLLEHGADRAAKSKDGRTAYDFALEGGHQAVADLLA